MVIISVQFFDNSEETRDGGESPIDGDKKFIGLRAKGYGPKRRPLRARGEFGNSTPQIRAKYDE